MGLLQFLWTFLQLRWDELWGLLQLVLLSHFSAPTRWRVFFSSSCKVKLGLLQFFLVISQLRQDGLLQFFWVISQLKQGKGFSWVLPCNLPAETRWSSLILLSRLPSETEWRIFSSSSRQSSPIWDKIIMDSSTESSLSLDKVKGLLLFFPNERRHSLLQFSQLRQSEKASLVLLAVIWVYISKLILLWTRWRVFFISHLPAETRSRLWSSSILLSKLLCHAQRFPSWLYVQRTHWDCFASVVMTQLVPAVRLTDDGLEGKYLTWVAE